MRREKGLINGYLYFKLCVNRSLAHLSLPLNIFDKGALLAVLMKVYGFEDWWIVVAFIALLVVALWVAGHADVKYNVFAMEQALNNRHDPQIQELLRRVKEK